MGKKRERVEGKNQIEATPSKRIPAKRGKNGTKIVCCVIEGTRTGKKKGERKKGRIARNDWKDSRIIYPKKQGMWYYLGKKCVGG